MFVEGDIEVRIKDAAARDLDEHELKLWLQQGFRDLACYRISAFRRSTDRSLRAAVAVKLSVAPEAEQRAIVQAPHDAARLRAYIESLFVGRGLCRCVGDPQLRQS